MSSLSFRGRVKLDFSISGIEEWDSEIPSFELGSKCVIGTSERGFDEEDCRKAFVNSFCDSQMSDVDLTKEASRVCCEARDS